VIKCYRYNVCVKRTFQDRTSGSRKCDCLPKCCAFYPRKQYVRVLVLAMNSSSERKAWGGGGRLLRSWLWLWLWLWWCRASATQQITVLVQSSWADRSFSWSENAKCDQSLLKHIKPQFHDMTTPVQIFLCISQKWGVGTWSSGREGCCNYIELD